MKKLSALIASFALTCAAGAAFAGDAPAHPPKHEGDGKGHMMGPRDCATVPTEHKERCEARNKMIAERMTKPRDCSKGPAEFKDRCEARNKALENCKDKAPGKDHHACMLAQRPVK